MPEKAAAASLVLEAGLVDDDEPPGLGVVRRGGEPGRLEAGPELPGSTGVSR